MRGAGPDVTYGSFGPNWARKRPTRLPAFGVMDISMSKCALTAFGVSLGKGPGVSFGPRFRFHLICRANMV